MPAIIELGKGNPGKLVLIERGRRHESFTFRVSFTCYKVVFRFLTRQHVIPNNFLLIPGQFMQLIRKQEEILAIDSGDRENSAFAKAQEQGIRNRSVTAPG